MRTKSITGILAIGMVLAIGILILVIGNTYADDSMVRTTGQKELDLSKPENIARLTGTWEGEWRNLSSGGNGTETRVFSYDPKDEETPFVSKAKRRGTALSDPKKWATARGKLEGGKLVFVATNFNTTYSLFEGADGHLMLRGETIGTHEGYNALQIGSVLHKTAEGQQAAQEAGKQ
jgi:hypothetical protein